MATKFELKGAKEMERRLKELGKDVATKTGRTALRTASRKTVLEEAKRLAPRDSGEYAEGLRIREDRRRGGQEDIVMRVVATAKPGLMHLLEFGTIKMAAKPHIRPAMDGQHNAWLDEVGKRLGQGINRAVRKINRGGR